MYSAIYTLYLAGIHTAKCYEVPSHGTHHVTTWHLRTQHTATCMVFEEEGKAMNYSFIRDFACKYSIYMYSTCIYNESDHHS